MRPELRFLKENEMKEFIKRYKFVQDDQFFYAKNSLVNLGLSIAFDVEESKDIPEGFDITKALYAFPPSKFTDSRPCLLLDLEIAQLKRSIHLGFWPSHVQVLLESDFLCISPKKKDQTG